MWPLLNLFFLQITFTIIFIGGLINFLEPYLPIFLVQAFRYGKFKHNGTPVFGIVEIPKSYFRHFYALAIIIFTFTLIFAVRVYFVTFHVPLWIIWTLDFLCGTNRTATCKPLAILLVLILLTIQCYRRFYETFFVQVFAKDSKINLSQYAIGHLHYIGCIIAILGGAPGFVKPLEDIEHLVYYDIWTIFGAIPTVALFYFAWINQFRSNKILANLRKDKKSNKVITEKHLVPNGGWFEYVSSPHQLCEVLIYISLTLLLKVNLTWFCVLFWVGSNQVETSLLSHWWYKKTFPNYPKQRKAIIPYVL